MGKKSLKKYNEETREWEIVSAPDVSVEVRLPDGTRITDNDVFIENENYSGGTLNEALDEINDDISRLERNVSWLDAHKGEGGGSGGGISSYKIKIISPNVDNGSMYINSDELKVQFTITGPSTEETCSYAYQFDEQPLSDYIPVKTNAHVYLPTINVPDGLSYHTLIIKAINPYGINIIPVTVNIYKSTLKLAFDESAAGSSYSNLTYYIKRNAKVANVPFLITNGMQDAEVKLHAEYTAGGNTKTISLGNLPSGTVSRNFDFWQLISKSEAKAGDQYVVEFYATSIIGTYSAESNRVTLRIAIVDPDVLSILIGVNGTTEEWQSVPVDSLIYYNFRVSAPIGVSSVYYAAKIENVTKNVSYLILGKYFDENTHMEGYTYTDNPTTERQTTIASSYFVSSTDFSENDNVNLVVKAWNFKNTQETAETEYKMTIGAADNSIFPRQYQPRENGGAEGDTLLFSWNKYNAINHEVGLMKWISKINNYNAISETLGTYIEATINIEDSNASSGMKEGAVPFMRLQNHAFAIADISEYSDEISLMTKSGEGYDEAVGFTISITLNADIATDNNHTLFLWGENNPDGTLKSGIRIDSDKIYWTIMERTSGNNISSVPLVCNFTCGIKKTVDFSFVKNSNSWNAIIYVNGIMNAAVDVNKILDEYSFPTTIYFGANVINGQKSRFSDANFYEFSVYTKALNDMQIVINGKNARLDGNSSEASVIDDYNKWKAKNFIKASETDPSKPESKFFDSEGNYITSFNSTTVEDIASKSAIPTLWVSFNSDSEFTYNFFYSKHTVDVTERYFLGKANYFDPETNETKKYLSNINIEMALQGTSTLGYRVKNVEMRMYDKFTKGTEEYRYLFQPKKEWFPESQFTIKADVVDSAHANNAVLGEWINNCGVLENNPAMNALNTETRPKDINDNGEIQEHTGKDGTLINYDEDVTIKHTLEGFPILLFIKFSDKQNYEFIGIYSFNLGRYSYYNMGMKFLKSFSARNDSGNRLACPRVIKYYEESETLGNVNTNNVFSFEFGNGGNVHNEKYPAWSQYDITVLQDYGEFKYPSGIGNSHEIWSKMQNLFKGTAEYSVDGYGDTPYNKFDGIYYYTVNSQGNYVVSSSEPIQQVRIPQPIEEGLNLNNAVAYFIIVNAFGMTDSLGKNMVLRTWDNGQRWYTCFYDMDTALGISNDGSENVPVTVSIDKIEMISSIEEGSFIKVIPHYDESKYAAVLSKLWGILRSNNFKYDASAYPTYEFMWNTLRQSRGKLAYADNFTSIMNERIATCGEIIYNYDYNQKYILGSNGQSSEGEVEPAINFLHGTRIDYVRDWLRKHFYYLDGIFPAGNDGQFDFVDTDSVYNRDQLTLSLSYSSTISMLSYTVQVSTPSFIGISIGGDKPIKYYIDTENTDIIIYRQNETSSNSQMTIYGSSVITKFNGLQGAFISIGSNGNSVARAMTIFDVSGSNILTTNPFSPNIFLYNGNSSVETLNLSRTRGGNGALSDYTVNVENFNKLLYFDCSNSDVTSVQLPKTALKTLNISNSNIKNFTLSEQNSLTEINFTGCKKLETVTLEKCDSIDELVLDSITNLSSVRVSGCTSLESIKINNCTNLTTIEIYANENLKEIEIYGCSRAETTFDIRTCPSLSSLTLSEIQSRGTVSIDTISARNIKTLDLNRFYYFTNFTYDTIPVERYSGVTVLDLSPMEFIEEASFTYVSNLRYLRVPNFDDAEHNAFKVRMGMFDNVWKITRIFGYIDICEYGVFKSCADFYLNEPDSKYDDGHNYNEFWEKGEVSFVTDNEYFTNIKISTDTLDGLMDSTSCNIGDVYNIFRNCPSTLTSVADMFRGCQNIRTSGDPTDPNYGSIDPRILMYCPNITAADGLFKDCGNLRGLIDKDIMETITQNVTSFSYVFPSQVFFDRSVELFAPHNSIKKIEGFSPRFCDMHKILEEGYFNDFNIQSEKLLKNCENVTLIKDSFNSTQVELLEGNCQLLKGLTKLEQIIESFNLKIASNVDCAKLICDAENLSDYSNRLKVIDGSFNFADREISSSESIKDILLVGNSFFASCKSTLTTVTGSFGGNIEKRIDTDDNFDKSGNTLNFPYLMLDGCVNLETLTGFFSNYDISGGRYDEERGDASFGDVITLPSYIYPNGKRIDLFDTCVKLKNISACFKNMKYGIYELVSNGFKNNSLENVSELFSESGNTHCYKQGMIPYRLFYQETIDGIINPTIKNMNSVFEGTATSAVTFYSHDVSSLTCLKNFCEDNANYGTNDTETKYVWNIYLNDGTSAVYDKITGMTQYVRLQELYQIIEAGGSTAGYEDLMDENGIPLYPKDLPDEYSDFDGSDARQVSTLGVKDIGYAEDIRTYSSIVVEKYFGNRNYFCPPDLFRYCANGISVNINGIFKNASLGIVNGTKTDGYCLGYYGRVPQQLFKPISKIISMEQVFYNFKMLLPHEWALIDGDTTTKHGTMYNPKMFVDLTDLEYTNEIFRGTTVWGRTEVKEIFNSLGKLRSAAGMWKSAMWLGENIPNVDSYASKINSNLFMGCLRLYDVSSMFENNGPKEMYDTLFQYSQQLITNCSAFMKNNGNTSEGKIPRFWEFGNVQYKSQAYHNVSVVWDDVLDRHQDYR